MAEGRGGHWNRDGRRGGGARRPIVYAFPLPVRCDVPDCTNNATHGIPVEEKVSERCARLDGQWYIPMCKKHADKLIEEME